MKHFPKALFLCIFVFSLPPVCLSHANGQSDNSDRLRITVHPYNYVRVPEEPVKAAEEVATSVLRQVGIELEWSDWDCAVPASGVGEKSDVCAVPLPRGDLAIFFVGPLEKHNPRVDPNALAYSLIPETHEPATTAYVSWLQIQKLSAATAADVTELMGLATAHEIGHLLLGSYGHANQGIMRATWRLRDLKAKAWGEFKFTQSQGKQLRVGVEARRHADELRAVAQK